MAVVAAGYVIKEEFNLTSGGWKDPTRLKHKDNKVSSCVLSEQQSHA